MSITILVLGFIFGGILQYAELNKYNVISGLARRENFAVAKALFVSIGLGAILLQISISLGVSFFHIKPFILGGILIGGLLFGSGMAILGYCPGTLAISLGEGALDAFFGILGGLLAAWIFTLLYPFIQGILGPDLGKISIANLIENKYLLYFVLIIIGFGFVLFAFILHKKENTKNMKWLYSGIALAILNVFVFSKYLTNRPIGASTTFPYLADLLTNTTQNDYFSKILSAGHWEMIFLAGAFIAGLANSVIKKEFKIILIYSEWEKYKGNSSIKRIIWSFIGGFVLIFGARMAGGCTSGHILSGGMQMAVSSLVFAVFVFVGLLLTGKLFYKK